MAKIYRVDPMMQITATNQTRDLSDLTAMYDAFTTSDDFMAQWPNYHGIPLLPGFGGRSAAFRQGSSRWIRMGSNRSESTMLHEIAHHVCDLHPDQYGPRTSHGPGFAAAMLDVTAMYQGARGRDALIAAYAQERIKVWRGGAAILLPAPPVLDEKVRDFLDALVVVAECRKAKAARERARRRDRTERIQAEIHEWSAWERIDYEFDKRARSAAAKKAWATRRARAAASA